MTVVYCDVCGAKCSGDQQSWQAGPASLLPQGYYHSLQQQPAQIASDVRYSDVCKGCREALGAAILERASVLRAKG